MNAVDKQGNTPLHKVAMGDSIKIAKLLLQAGAKTDAINHGGETPHAVALKHHSQVASLLQNGI